MCVPIVESMMCVCIYVGHTLEITLFLQLWYIHYKTIHSVFPVIMEPVGAYSYTYMYAV